MMNMLSKKEIALLEIMALEVMEDISLLGDKLGENTACCVFYEMVNGVKTYIDYEVAESDPEEYRELLPEDEQIEFDKVDKSNLEVVNIVYDDEEIDLMSLKDLLFLIIEAVHPDYPMETIAFVVYLNIRQISPNALSKMLGVSHQTVYQIAKNQIPLPKKRREEIAKLLKFDVSEYDRQKQNPVFDLK